MALDCQKQCKIKLNKYTHLINTYLQSIKINNKKNKSRKILSNFTITYVVFCINTIKMLTNLSYYDNINLSNPANVV